VNLLLILGLLAFVGSLFYLALPLRRRPQPLPEGPQRDDLLAELKTLQEAAKEAEGAERKALLARIVLIRRALEEGAPPPPQASRNWLWALALGALVLAGLGIWQGVLPQLPRPPQPPPSLTALAKRAQTTHQLSDWLAYGQAAWQAGALDQAASAYLEVARQDPHNLTAIRRLGIILFLSGHPNAAERLLLIAAHQDPGHPNSWFFLGNLYFQEGRYAQAIQAWQSYLNEGGPAIAQVDNLIQTAQARLKSRNPGQQVYLEYCAVCHGVGGQGGTGPRLEGNPVLKLPAALTQIITQGMGNMPAIPLGGQQLQLLLNYLKGLG